MMGVTSPKLKIFNVRYYCWCSSNMALSWLRDEPSILNGFVANRILSIQELTGVLFALDTRTIISNRVREGLAIC